MGNLAKKIILRRFNGNGFDIAFPKTLLGQVEEIKNHLADQAEHLTVGERATISKYAILSVDGTVSMDAIDKSMLAINKEYANTDTLLADFANIRQNSLVMVVDATGDTTVKSGWAVYRKTGTDGTTMNSFQKICEQQALDLAVTYGVIDGRPSYTVAELDSFVQADHTHANQATLATINEDMFSRAGENVDIIKYDKQDKYVAGTQIYLLEDIPGSAQAKEFKFLNTDASIDLNNLEAIKGAKLFNVSNTEGRTITFDDGNATKVVTDALSGNKFALIATNAGISVDTAFASNWTVSTNSAVAISYKATSSTDASDVKTGTLNITIKNSAYLEEYIAVLGRGENNLEMMTVPQYAASTHWTTADFYGDGDSGTRNVNNKKIHLWYLGFLRDGNATEFTIKDDIYIPDEAQVANGLTYDGNIDRFHASTWYGEDGANRLNFSGAGLGSGVILVRRYK